MPSDNNQTILSDLDNEREFVMWEPLSFEVYPGYDYLRRGCLQRLSSLLLRSFAFFVLSVYNRVALGMKVTGRKNLKKLGQQGAVVVCNHIHQMDCTMLDLAFVGRRTHYITLQATFRIPFIRHLVRLLGGVPISNNAHCTAELFSAMGDAAKHGALICVYPEGVLSPYCQTLREFKSGAFRLAAANGLAVLPCTITQHKPRGLFALYKHKPCLHINILSPVFCPNGVGNRSAARQLWESCRKIMNRSIRNEAK